MVNRDSRLMGILVLILSLFVYMGAKAQNVVRQGNTFIEQCDSTSRGVATKTQYLYTDKNGVVDTVYLSGATYRKYLPKVTEMLGTKRN